MRSGAVRLCLVSVWWAAVGTSLPPPCPPRSSLYQRDGRDHYCIADTNDCQIKYVRNQFIRNPESPYLTLLPKETCSLCLPSCCSQQPLGAGVCSGLRLNNSLEFFGFNKTEQGWERATEEHYIFIVPARSRYKLEYYIPHGYCYILFINYKPLVRNTICAQQANAKVSTCTMGEHQDGEMCGSEDAI
ncbi:hypothetical protein EVAR_89515_1 [Eumeta japonica]|uniref:Methuselah N-terminal domain-containing protein n=1 Tax=Eumeta variegata TaxID=151549 RepID=A0A4C1Y5H7_EUMVA|nr:hypothetical protein EVAR_89515_1 [Eumeta japonica]